eukprot:486955_1
MSENTIKEGCLDYCSLNSHYEQKWIQLSNETIIISNKRNSIKPLIKINLQIFDQIQKLPNSAHIKTNKYEFELISQTSLKSHKFRTNTEYERDLWLKNIQQSQSTQNIITKPIQSTLSNDNYDDENNEILSSLEKEPKHFTALKQILSYNNKAAFIIVNTNIKRVDTKTISQKPTTIDAITISNCEQKQNERAMEEIKETIETSFDKLVKQNVNIEEYLKDLNKKYVKKHDDEKQEKESNTNRAAKISLLTDIKNDYMCSKGHTLNTNGLSAVKSGNCNHCDAKVEYICWSCHKYDKRCNTQDYDESCNNYGWCKNCAYKNAKEVKKMMIQIRDKQEEMMCYFQTHPETALDLLSGLPGKRALEFLLSEICVSALLRRLGYCLYIFDIDNFRDVNESLGHNGADKKLKQIANILQDLESKPNEFWMKKGIIISRIWCFRQGGDEFCIIVKGEYGKISTQKGFYELLKREINKISINICVGILAYGGCEWNTANTVDKWLELADKYALYSAKAVKGKNSFRIYDASQDKVIEKFENILMDSGSKQIENIEMKHDINISDSEEAKMIIITGIMRVNELESCAVYSLKPFSLFPTVRTSVGVKKEIGKYYYEFVVESIGIEGRSGLGQVGWADDQCNPVDSKQKGIGDDTHSWAFDGGRQKKWHNGSTSYGKKWKKNDIIGCGIRIRDGKKNTFDLTYYLNDECLGIAFENCQYTGNIYPAFSTQRGRMYGRMVFNKDEFKFLPDHYTPLF